MTGRVAATDPVHKKKPTTNQQGTKAMKRPIRTALSAGVALVALAGAAAAQTVIIGHFGNPTPMQIAAVEGRFAEATGWDIEWRKFAAGTDVIAAMASGDVNVSELGSSPLAIAASQGVDLEMIMLAQVIGTAESLIVRDDAGIAAIEDLKDKRIAVPIGSTAHFSLMGAIQHAGMSETDLTIMGMPPDQIAAAWEQGAIDGAFVWNPVQSQILETGTRLVGADETAEWGFPTFDAWVVNKDFAEANREAVVAFVRTMEEANAAYLADPAAWTPDSPQVQGIAEYTGADASQVPEIIAGYTFMPIADQLGEAWLGGGLAEAMKSTAAFLESAGRIDSVAEDYTPFLNATFATEAAGAQ
jgi:taurine transport system substrate-binding protein